MKALCAVDTTIKFSIDERAKLDPYFDIVFVDFIKPIDPHLIEASLMLVHSKVPNEVLKKFANCKYIGIRAHNIDYVDSTLSNERGITVIGIPQVGANAVAEHTFSLIFALAKQIVQSDLNVKTGKWRDDLTPNYELNGKKLGIIGYGTIGQMVANIGKALGMEILISARDNSEELGRIPLEELLKQSDIVTIHASTKPGNEQLISKDRIALMKAGAILINTARGKLLDYDALETALQSGKLWGAGLDVFAEEPLRNLSITQLPNVVCTPHLAFYTDRTLSIMNSHLINNVIQYYEKVNIAASLELVKPSIEYQEDYYKFYKEWIVTGEDMVPWVIEKDPANFNEYISFLFSQDSEDKLLVNDFVPHSTYWLADSQRRILGAVNIRHRLNEKLANSGGHIGYGIRPSTRRLGYASKLLALALEKTKELGIDKVLVVCDKGNLGSERTILKNGGVFDSEFIEESGNIVKRFWINS